MLPSHGGAATCGEAWCYQQGGMVLPRINGVAAMGMAEAHCFNGTAVVLPWRRRVASRVRRRCFLGARRSCHDAAAVLDAAGERNCQPELQAMGVGRHERYATDRYFCCWVRAEFILWKKRGWGDGR